MSYYDEIAQGYDELHEREQLNKLNLIKEHVDIKPDHSLLDVGCGSGISTAFFKCQATGIDPSQQLVSIARMKRDGKYLIGSAESLPFATNEFEHVISVTAIQNFTDVEKGLKEIKRVGKKTFVLTALKRSPQISLIKEKIGEHFKIEKQFEENKDLIFICKK
jgi:ubiquinone/menaquinone biosynthesis C-methylase UbiE